MDGLDIVQRSVEEGRKLILLAASRERRQDLIEMQVSEEVGLLRTGVDLACAGLEQDASKRPRDLTWRAGPAITVVHQLPPVWVSVEAISRTGISGGPHRLHTIILGAVPATSRIQSRGLGSELAGTRHPRVCWRRR